MVERILGKAEVDSSILSGGTIFSPGETPCSALDGGRRRPHLRSVNDRSDTPKDAPPQEGPARAAEREARLAKALRDNLRRRKAGGRSGGEETSGG